MTDNELRNKFYNEVGEKAYDGFLPNITYKTKYVEWLEQQVKNCSTPAVVGKSEQLFCKCGFEKKGNTVPCIRTDCDNLLVAAK